VKSPIIGEPYIGHDGAGGVGGVGGVGAGGLQLSPGHVQGLAGQPEGNLLPTTNFTTPFPFSITLVSTIL